MGWKNSLLIHFCVKANNFVIVDVSTNQPLCFDRCYAELSRLPLCLVMHDLNPWTLEKWHVRLALRQHGVSIRLLLRQNLILSNLNTVHSNKRAFSC